MTMSKSYEQKKRVKVLLHLPNHSKVWRVKLKWTDRTTMRELEELLHCREKHFDFATSSTLVLQGAALLVDSREQDWQRDGQLNLSASQVLGQGYGVYGRVLLLGRRLVPGAGYLLGDYPLQS